MRTVVFLALMGCSTPLTYDHPSLQRLKSESHAFQDLLTEVSSNLTRLLLVSELTPVKIASALLSVSSSEDWVSSIGIFSFLAQKIDRLIDSMALAALSACS